MFYCEECESYFEECKVIKEHHPYGMGTAVEEWYVCPYCESTHINEAKQCAMCGEYVPKLEDGMCDCCYGDMYGE